VSLQRIETISDTS